MTQTFDQHAATEAYLAALSPAGHAKATAYTQGGHWILLGGAIVTLLVIWIVIRTGVLGRMVDGIERKRAHPVFASFAVAVVFSILTSVLTLPWDVYAHWWREKSYGLTSQSLDGWLTENLIGTLIGAVFSGLFLMALYALIRRAPKTWWAWSGGLAAAFVGLSMVLAPVFIEPIFNKYTPAPPGEVRDAVVALAKEAGVPSDKIYIYNGSKQSNRYTANVSGLFSSARVAMSDVMFAKGADIAEVRGVVGHEMGHYKRGHVLWGAAVISLLVIVMFFLVDRLFPLAARLLGSDAAGISDPAGLPVIFAVLTVLGLLATPVASTLTRIQEADADHFSFVHANEPDGLAKALVKTIEYRADSPSDLEEFIFYDHPSVRHRVEAAMAWKAAHPK